MRSLSPQAFNFIVYPCTSATTRVKWWSRMKSDRNHRYVVFSDLSPCLNGVLGCQGLRLHHFRTRSLASLWTSYAMTHKHCAPVPQSPASFTTSARDISTEPSTSIRQIRLMDSFSRLKIPIFGSSVTPTPFPSGSPEWLRGVMLISLLSSLEFSRRRLRSSAFLSRR